VERGSVPLPKFCVKLPHAKCHWNKTTGCWVMVKKQFLKWRPSAILNFKNFIFGHVTVSTAAIMYQISSKPLDYSLRDGDFTIRHLEFRGSIMGSLKSSCRTPYRSSIETTTLNYLVFEKFTFYCMHFGDRHTEVHTDTWTDRRTDRQNERVKALLLSRAEP